MGFDGSYPRGAREAGELHRILVRRAPCGGGEALFPDFLLAGAVTLRPPSARRSCPASARRYRRALRASTPACLGAPCAPGASASRDAPGTSPYASTRSAWGGVGAPRSAPRSRPRQRPGVLSWRWGGSGRRHGAVARARCHRPGRSPTSWSAARSSAPAWTCRGRSPLTRSGASGGPDQDGPTPDSGAAACLSSPPSQLLPTEVAGSNGQPASRRAPVLSHRPGRALHVVTECCRTVRAENCRSVLIQRCR